MNNNTKSIAFKPIGFIETPFDDKQWIPRQGKFGKSTKGIAVVFPEFAGGLQSLEQFRYCWLLFHFDRSTGYNLHQIPPKDNKPHGVFSIRSPKRPNGLGMTSVKIEKIEGNKIYFTGADMINNTPLIDVKPYVEAIDSIPDSGNGWMDNIK